MVAQDVVQLLAAANHYELERLIMICATFISKHIQVDNACCLLLSAHQLDQVQLFQKVKEFIEDNMDAVVHTQAFRELPEELIVDLLRVCCCWWLDGWWLMLVF